MRSQIKHLKAELSQYQDNNVTMQTNDNVTGDRELEEAREMIRNLNSQNSELRSKLEVLASATRECSESRSTSSVSGDITNHDEIVETSFSESSSESFEEIGKIKETETAATSTDSFDKVDNDVHVNNDNNITNDNHDVPQISVTPGIKS